jgi:hypothetical protein
MIIVKIIGGLGNQMFQYALGRSLSIRNKDILKLDLSAFDNQKAVTEKYLIRKSELENFNTLHERATPEEIERLKNPYGKLSKYWRAFCVRVLKQSTISFKKKFLRKKGGIYLDGYFQSERYFMDHRDILIKEFSNRNCFSPASKEIYENILRDVDSLSLHIRRGDNAYNKSSMKVFGMPANSYYTEAIERVIRETKKSLHNLYIFSDDIDWVRKNIKISLPTTYVSRDGMEAWEELLMMSRCKNNIISNSTFSWWAAWLNQNDRKVVIAPKHWANVSKRHFKKIIPSGWIRI